MTIDLGNFINPQQLKTMTLLAASSEERQFFKDKLADVKRTILIMPEPYGTDGQGLNAVIYLHYFIRGSDFWIIEKDSSPKQIQAFGYACLNGDTINAELGYINIDELLQYGVELDLFWKPITLETLFAQLKPSYLAPKTPEEVIFEQ